VFIRFLYIEIMCLRLWIGLVIVTALTASVHADWGGYVNSSAVSNRMDTTTTQSVDQQYQFYFDGTLLPTLSYSVTTRFRHAQSNNPYIWHREFEPSLTATWTTPLLRVSGNGYYRENRDRYSPGSLIGRSIDVSAQTAMREVPQFFGQLLFERNVNNLDLLGLDTRLRNVTAGADYRYRMLHLRYDFSDALTTNEQTRLDVSSQQHTGRGEFGLHLFQRALSVQSAYQITASHQIERQRGTGAILLPLAVVAGLYAADPTPDFGTLDSKPSLVDDDVTTSAGLDFDLSSNVYHNFGLDFGTAVRVDHLYLYTDTLANPNLPWAVFVSSDNQTWTRIAADAAYPFVVAFSQYRYEIAFAAQTTRYIKIVLQPQPQTGAVHVTELRAYVTQSEQVEDVRPVDQRGSLDIRMQPGKWLSIGLTGWLQETGRSQFQQERQQQNGSATVSMPFHRLFNLSGLYQTSRVTFAGMSPPRTQSEQFSSTWNAQWLSTLTTRASASRTREVVGELIVRRLDGVSLQMMALIFPQLRSVSEISQTEDHRFGVADIYRSRAFRQSADARPTPRSVLNAQYRYERFSSLRASLPSQREALELQGGYELTSAISLRGDASWYREGSSRLTSWNGSATWNVLPTLSVSSGYSRSRIPHGGSNDLITADASFRPLPALTVQGGYSRGSYTQDSRLNNTNLRLGINLRF
jgi:hypothetical protein